MTSINHLLILLHDHGGRIVNISSLTSDDIKQAKASGRLIMGNDGYGIAWEPDLKKFPTTEEELDFFDRWYPLDVEPPEGLFEKIMAAIDEENKGHVPYIKCDCCGKKTEYYSEVNGSKFCMKCMEVSTY